MSLHALPPPFEQIRVLAATDPRAARSTLSALLDAGSREVDSFLRTLDTPGEGRLRQLVANVVRTRADKDRLVPHLTRWLEQENDEFARAAIVAALKGVDVTRHRAGKPADPPDLVDTYRYVASRLCHRVRNAMYGPATHLLAIEDLAQRAPEPARSEMQLLTAQLRDAFRQVARIVEFETGDDYFMWRPVRLCSWIATSAHAYAARNELIRVDVVTPAGGDAVVVRATAFHLETIFWNLWKNASQTVNGPCTVKVEVTSVGGHVNLVLIDDGPGFVGELLLGVAFEERFSTRGPDRGRGLLEVADAVRRLSGHVSLIRRTGGDLRVRILLPLEEE